METSNQIFCTSCGNQMNAKAEFCPSCGAQRGANNNNNMPNNNIPYQNQNSMGTMNVPMQQKKVNLVLATLLAYFIPGLPQIIWFKQTTKGITLIAIAVFSLFVLPLFCDVILGILAAIDAYQLGKKYNAGIRLGQWTFFWDK